MPSRGGGAAQAGHHHEAATRALLAIFLIAPLAACAIGVTGPPPEDEVPPPIGIPECNADACDIAGQGTLRQLGLDTAAPFPPPDPDTATLLGTVSLVASGGRGRRPDTDSPDSSTKDNR